MRKVIVFVNRVEEVGFRQTTALLIASFVRNGCRVILAGIDDLSIETTESSFQATTHGVEVPLHCKTSELVDQLAKSTQSCHATSIGTEDLVVIRTNPGRDIQRQILHHSSLNLMRIIEANGTQVINSPSQLTLFTSKASLATIEAQFRPEMIVSQNTEEICEFVARAPSDCVVKPLVGSRGENVIRVNAAIKNLAERLAKTFKGEAMVAQHFVESSHLGDRRVVVLDGEILELNGHIAGIERHPASNDFRANLHAGGTAHPLTLNAKERAAATHAASLLADNGIRLAGVDLIGDQIIELNVFSTGGIFDANRFATDKGNRAFDFTEAIAKAFLLPQKNLARGENQ